MKSKLSSFALACSFSFVFALAICLTSVLLTPGCTTSQQQTAYNTLYAVEATTTAAVDSYDYMVIHGELSTNDLPRVSKSFDTFQISFLAALDAAQFNTNALAPASLVIESKDLINLVTVLKGQKP